MPDRVALVGIYPCLMLSTGMAQVDVRELYEQLTTYLDRVRNGETIEVTDRGMPIAMLMPLPEERRRSGHLGAVLRSST